MTPVIIGTAGHIDHGKSALLEKLTGTNPDRLEEEQRRGLTIDIGFAFLNEDIAFIDVPGHERFVKNMVTGASAIDMAMLVIAADDGVMPQTREHLAILKLLGINSGLIVLTKTDLVKEDWIELVIDDISQLVKSSFLEGAQILQVSSKTGDGISDLKDRIINLSTKYQRKTYTNLFRLPIDRIFSIKGYGTIVTGTILSGEARLGDEVELIPAGKKLSIRGIQSHNLETKIASTGNRAAINLQRIEKQSIKRGDYLCTPGFFKSSDILTCQISLLKNAPQLKYNSKVRIHIGTGEFIARIRLIGKDKLLPGESAISQLLFQEKISAGFKDRFIMRNYSPLMTIGGGIVLQVCPKPLRKKNIKAAEILKKFIKTSRKECLQLLFENTPYSLFSKQELAWKLSLDILRLTKYLDHLINDKKIVCIKDDYILKRGYRDLKENLIVEIRDFHRRNPLTSGITKPELLSETSIEQSMGNSLLEILFNDGVIKYRSARIQLTDFQIKLSKTQEKSIENIEKEIVAAGSKKINEIVNITDKEVKNIITLMIEIGRVILLGDNILIHKTTLESYKTIVKEYLIKNGKAKVTELKEAIGTSRKLAIPLLNYFDQTGLTMREGDLRRLLDH